jgi:hypothetical protein
MRNARKILVKELSGDRLVRRYIDMRNYDNIKMDLREIGYVYVDLN